MLMKLRSKMQSTNNQKGFTLVELMVVVVIIGVLVAIAVPIYNNVSEKAKLNAHLANIRTIEGAIESYKAANDTAALSTIDVTQAGVGVLIPNYIREWPTKPGTYTVTDGVLTANPTKAATITAIGGGTAVAWP
ncbi:prepilin-type N-terminal cleavage/methylation domain-containing protein [Syntrophomonas curvata]